MRDAQTIESTQSAADRRGSGVPLAVAIALAVLACLPYLVVERPQLTDYPSHLARFHVMLDGARSVFLSQYYDFAWIWTGNLGADLLMIPLGKALGVERAGWLIGALIPPLTGLGVLAVEWVLRRRIGVGSLLALAAVWSPAMGMGFYNFCLALALALLAFALWVQLEGWRWRWAVFVPVGLIVWLCHVSGWGVLGVLVFGYQWSRDRSWRAFLAPWPLATPFLALLAGPKAAGALNYGDRLIEYKTGIWLQALRDQSAALDIASVAMLALAILVAAIRRRIDGRLGWAALMLAVLTLAMPRHLGGGDYADYRLIAVALMVGCLAIDVRSPPRWLLMAAPLLFAVRLAVTTQAWAGNSAQLERDLHALDHIPQGARVAGAVGVHMGAWALNPFEHAPSYATVRRDALVNSHFAVRGVHMLTLKQGGAGFVDPSQRVFYNRRHPVDLSRFAPAAQADYLWYFGKAAPVRLPAGAVVVFRSQGSLLARLAKPVGGG